MRCLPARLSASKPVIFVGLLMLLLAPPASTLRAQAATATSAPAGSSSAKAATKDKTAAVTAKKKVADPAPSVAVSTTPLALKPLCAGDTVDPKWTAVDAKSGIVEGLIHLPGDDSGAGAVVTLTHEQGEKIVLTELPGCSDKVATGILYRVAMPVGKVNVSLSRPRPGGFDCMGTKSNDSSPSATEAACVTDTANVEVLHAEPRRADLILTSAPTSGRPNTHYLYWVPLAFVFIIWLIRWNHIALPTHRGLMAAVDNITSRLKEAGFPHNAGPVAELHRLSDRKTSSRYLDFFWWSRGWEIAGWQTLHQAEQRLIERTTMEEVDAQLISAQQILTEMNTAGSNGMLGRLQAALLPANLALAVKQALLVQTMDYIAQRDDTDFSTLTSWQNKATFLTLIGLLLVFALGGSVGHAELFVAGAAGGFLSRLMRQLKRADVPSDYGASWATLFLSPVSGALAGWFGVVLIMLSANTGLLGPLVAVDWNSSSIAKLLATAFLLGFSERLFDSVLREPDETIDQKKKNADTAKVVEANLPDDKRKKNGGNDDDGNGGGGDDSDKQKTLAAKKADQDVGDAGGQDGTPASTGQQGAAPKKADAASPQAATNALAAVAGASVTMPLERVDPGKVKQVILVNQLDKGETPATSVVAGEKVLSFTVPAGLASGLYDVALVAEQGRLERASTISVG